LTAYIFGAEDVVCLDIKLASRELGASQ